MKCFCCDTESSTLIMEGSEPTSKFEKKDIGYYRCAVCQTVSKQPHPAPEALRAYYEQSWQFSEPRPDRCWTSAAKWMAASMPKQIRNGIDVGGKDLSIFRALATAGVIVAKQSVLDAQPKSGDVMPAWLGQGFVSQHVYDLVIATHVLEHAIDPRAFLDDVRMMMTAGAWAYIEVPCLEYGSSDVSTGDDLCPSHLWHFTVPGLAMLFYKSGFYVVKIEADRSVPGWPCTRVLAQTRQRETDPFADLHDTIRSCYDIATFKITDQYQKGDALYGASTSCWRLHEHDKFLRETVKSMPIYDLNKTGYFLGRPIRKPEQMLADGIKRVWLTPRFWNSQTEIGRWLTDNYPTIEVLNPYK